MIWWASAAAVEDNHSEAISRGNACADRLNDAQRRLCPDPTLPADTPGEALSDERWLRCRIADRPGAVSASSRNGVHLGLNEHLGYPEGQ